MVAGLAPAATNGEACEATPTARRLTIVIENIRSSLGLMTSALFANDGHFLKPIGSVGTWRTAAQGPIQTICVWLAKPGGRAIAVNHDLNANRPEKSLGLQQQPTCAASGAPGSGR